jgi:spore coat polysaccharide biosynthesis protein SpsF (cytidylyltransferase family)
MRTRAGIILQARAGSSRLPGKALATIGTQTILEHCLRRLMFAGVAPVVLATTRRPEDDALESVARALGAGVFRGDATDVLSRYVNAADAFGFDTLIRATGDNPGVDIQAPGRLLAVMRASQADYAAEDGLPYGAAVEAVTREALARAGHQSYHAEDREHVTTYVRRNTQIFHVQSVPAPAPLRRPDVRLTVDTVADLEHVRELFARAGVSMPSLRQLIEAAGRPIRTEACPPEPGRRRVA